MFLMEKCKAQEIGEFVNIGVGTDVTIRELVQLIADTVGFKGRLVFDITKPDCTPCKSLDVSRLSALGWTAQTSLEKGLAVADSDYLSKFS